MRYWVTPFQLSATALSTLNEAGLQPWPAEDWSALPDAESLLLYDSPDQLIAMVGSGPETEGLTAQSLLQGYRRLLDWSERLGQPLLAISQLQRLGPEALRSWFDDGDDDNDNDNDDASPSPASLLPIPPLLASVCLSLFEDEPALLDCYHDLELRAALLGRDPDLRYRERLLQAGQQGNAQLQAFLASQRLQAASSELEKRLASRDTELREAREASEQSLQVMHQVQEALQRSIQADAEKQRQLEAGVRELEELQHSKAELESAHDLAKAARECEHDQDKAAQQREHDQELEALRQRLEPRVADLELGLASRDVELREAREASEQSLQVMHQVQEALQRSVQADAEKQRQLEAGVRDLEELRRIKTAQESAHEQATAAQQREHEQEKAALQHEHDQELLALRQQLEPRLAELEQRLVGRDTELRQARETAATSLLQLHQQVQEERDRHSLADAEKQRQLEAGVRDLEELRRIKAAQENAHELVKSAQASAHEQELEALRQRLEPQLAELEQRFISRDTELREAREAAELSLLQLHQVQEELEHCFLADAEKQRQLEAGVRDLDELRRTKADQESNYEQAKAAQQREHEQEKAAHQHEHDQELQALREQFEPRLAELEQRLISRDTELSEAREIAEMSLLQLHQQVQEERERHSMAEGEMQRLLEAGVRDLEELRRIKTAQENTHELVKSAQASAHEQELEALRQRLEPQLTELEQRLISRDTELREAREAAELSLLQLHQLQEELEHYFLADAEKQRQLEAGVRDLEELRRSKADQESNYEQANAAQQRAHDQELEALREQFEPRLAELEQRLIIRDTELREAREIAEMSLLQLHQQVQEDRGRHSMAESAQASAHEQELEALRQRLEPQLTELEQRLISRDTELREAREAAELSLLQLHQVQEELEHYFLADAEKQRRLEAGVRDLEELRRSKADQESNYEQANAAQQRAHDQELEALREQFEPRLAELEQRLIIRDTELREAREIAEMSLLQLHQQVQEERERHSMAEGEIQRQLEAGVRDLEELRRIKTDQESAHEQAKAELQQGLASSESQLRQAREEAEMTFEQLHQAQEELEHYFLKARAGDQLAQSQMEQLQRAQSLMVRLNPDVLPNAPYPPALAVEVLSELPAAMPDPSLQTQALLSTYAASLQRASALLQRARRS
jgi:hypothetical protein